MDYRFRRPWTQDLMWVVILLAPAMLSILVFFVLGVGLGLHSDEIEIIFLGVIPGATLPFALVPITHVLELFQYRNRWWAQDQKGRFYLVPKSMEHRYRIIN